MKDQKEKRKERAKKLLRLGIVLELTNVIKYEKEIILGYLCKLKDATIFERNKFIQVGDKILGRIEELDSKKINELSYIDIKARNHFLITRGALFEIAEVDEKLNVILGFLLELSEKNESYITRCYQEGALYFIKKGRKYDRKN